MIPLPVGAVLLGTQAFYVGDAPSSVTWTDLGPAAWADGRLRTVDPTDGHLLREEATGRPLWLAGGDRVEEVDERRVRWAGRVFELGERPFDAALLADGSAVLVTVARAGASGTGVDGVIVRLGEDGSVRELVRVAGDMVVPLDVAGDRIAAGTHDHGRVLAWTLDRSGAAVPLLDVPGHTNGVGAVAWLPDGRLLTGGYDDRVVLRDGSGEPLAESGGYGGRVLALSPSADGARFVAIGPMEAQLRAVDGTKLAALGSYRCQGTSAAWSPDGALVAVTCAEGDLGVFDPATGASRLRIGRGTASSRSPGRRTARGWRSGASAGSTSTTPAPARPWPDPTATATGWSRSGSRATR